MVAELAELLGSLYSGKHDLSKGECCGLHVY